MQKAAAALESQCKRAVRQDRGRKGIREGDYGNRAGMSPDWATSHSGLCPRSTTGTLNVLVMNHFYLLKKGSEVPQILKWQLGVGWKPQITTIVFKENATMVASGQWNLIS